MVSNALARNDAATFSREDPAEWFEREPRVYALDLVGEAIGAEELLMAALKWMSHDDVREMLDANELSPRFILEGFES
jgi:hypothetical protein